MGLRLDASMVLFRPEDGSLSVDLRELGVRLAIGGWNDGLPVRILVEGHWEDCDADPELPVFHSASRLPPTHPIRAFVDTIPPEARALLPLFHEHQITLLRLLRLGAAAVQLAASAPNLVWLMLPVVARMDGQDVDVLLRQRRTEVLAAVLGTPATPEMLRFVQRYEPAARVPHEREMLVRTLARPAILREFRHGAAVTMARLRVATALSEWLRFRSVKELVVAGDRPLEAYDAPMLARDVRRLADDLGIVDAETAIARTRTLEDLRGLHDRWMERSRRQFHEQLASGQAEAQGTQTFPLAPVPGTDEIVYLDTAKELLAEGRAMHHCVGSYVRDCVAGRAFIYLPGARAGEGDAGGAGEGRGRGREADPARVQRDAGGGDGRGGAGVAAHFFCAGAGIRGTATNWWDNRVSVLRHDRCNAVVVHSLCLPEAHRPAIDARARRRPTRGVSDACRRLMPLPKDRRS